MESFEVFNQFQVKEFIEKNQDFIDEYPDLFRVDYRTLKGRNNEVFNFIRCLFPNCPNRISKEVFDRFSKSLNLVRSYVKKEKRKEMNETPDENSNDSRVGKMYKNLYTNNSSPLLIKVVKETKCFVFFKEAKCNTFFIGQEMQRKVLIENDEIQWIDKELKVKKINFNCQEISSMDEIKDLKKMMFID